MKAHAASMFIRGCAGMSSFIRYRRDACRKRTVFTRSAKAKRPSGPCPGAQQCQCRPHVTSRPTTDCVSRSGPDYLNGDAGVAPRRVGGLKPRAGGRFCYQFGAKQSASLRSVCRRRLSRTAPRRSSSTATQQTESSQVGSVEHSFRHRRRRPSWAQDAASTG